VTKTYTRSLTVIAPVEKWKTALDKFWSQVAVRPGGDDCWLWKGPVDRNGYGRTSFNGVSGLAHRRAFTIVCGDPQGFHIHHSCGTRLCCNPLHLTPLTPSDHRFVTSMDRAYVEQETL
jgi:hypothetical protein